MQTNQSWSRIAALAAASVLMTGSLAVAQVTGITAGSAASKALAELQADYTAARQEYSEKVRELMQTQAYKDASKARDRDKMTELRAGLERVDTAAFAERAFRLAGEQAADARVPFYSWIRVNTGSKEVAVRVLAAIRADHMESPALLEIVEKGYLLPRLLGASGEGLLRELGEKHPSDTVRAWSIYWSAYPVTRDKDATEEARANADAMLEQAASLAKGTLLEDRIRAPKFEADNLQIGMEAPDIEGVDTDGVGFKLSDYRGKVVVLDFWGFW